MRLTLVLVLLTLVGRGAAAGEQPSQGRGNVTPTPAAPALVPSKPRIVIPPVPTPTPTVAPVTSAPPGRVIIPSTPIPTAAAPTGRVLIPPTPTPALTAPQGRVSTYAPSETGSFQRLLELHNAARARSGRGPLTLDAGLCADSQRCAQAQAQRRACGHFLSLAGASAENCAAGQGSEDEVHGSWVRSPGHYANILGPYSRVGFGVVHGPGGPYWTARFAR